MTQHAAFKGKYAADGALREMTPVEHGQTTRRLRMEATLLDLSAAIWRMQTEMNARCTGAWPDAETDQQVARLRALSAEIEGEVARWAEWNRIRGIDAEAKR